MQNLENVSLETNLTMPSFPAPIPDAIKFWTYVIAETLSVPCAVFVLYHLLLDRTLRRALNNHVIVVMLLLGMAYELVSLPWTLYRLRHGQVWLSTPFFFMYCFFVDYGLYTTQVVLFTWATIERHILIFHDRWVSTRKRRMLVHYLPLVSIPSYCLIYFAVITFGPFCENNFESGTANGVFVPCVYGYRVFGAWDLLFHQVLMTLIVIVLSITLIIRVVWQKRQRNQAVHWRNYRKMTIQLLSISALYLVFNLPWVSLLFAALCGLSDEYTTVPILCMDYFRLYLIFLFPFVCCGALSELRSKWAKMWLCQKLNRIAPHA